MKKIFGLTIIYRLNTKIRLTMLCLSGFELHSRWVPFFKHRLFDIFALFVVLFSVFAV